MVDHDADGTHMNLLLCTKPFQLCVYAFIHLSTLVLSLFVTRVLSTCCNVYNYNSSYIYIYIYARPPPPRSTLRGSKAFALRTPSTYALERKTEREQERRREFITRKKDRENKQIRTCVPVLLNGRMA